MNATKRKFNALLQGLSTSRPDDSGSLASSTTAPSATELLAQKRRRLLNPDRTRTILSTRASSSSKPNSTTTPGPLQNDASLQAPKARYCPSDRSELLKRLATFQEITEWTPKPEIISEIEWAKRGWICKGKERVRCMLCHKEVVVKLREDQPNADSHNGVSSEELQSSMADKYAEMIVSSHQDECLWRKRGCEASLLRLPLANVTSSLGELRQRYKELLARASSLPYESNLRIPEELDVESIISKLPPDFAIDPSPSEAPSEHADPPQLNRPALILALMGWQGLSNSRLGAVASSASCHACLRRLGLWMFKSKEVDSDGNVVVPASMDYLDVIWEHRFFCPWKSAVTQSREGESVQRPGWEILQKTISNAAQLRGFYGVSPRPASKTTQNESGNPPATPVDATKNAREEIETPTRQTPSGVGPPTQLDPDDETTAAAKDKERWARLRRVKSLFETKRGRRSGTTLSRPQTGQSTINKVPSHSTPKTGSGQPDSTDAGSVAPE